MEPFDNAPSQHGKNKRCTSPCVLFAPIHSQSDVFLINTHQNMTEALNAPLHVLKNFP